MFFALEVEAAAVFRELSKQGTRRLPSPRFRSPTGFGFPNAPGKDCWEWTGCVLGPGSAFEKHLGDFWGRLDYKPDWVILAGFSGGLGPRAQRGSAFEIGEVRKFSGEQESGISKIQTHWTQPTNFGFAPGVSTLHASEVLCEPEDKTHAFQNSSCDLVDMESLFFGQAMQNAVVSHSILRAVSDGPNECLPPQAINWMDEFGGLKARQLAWDLICGPWLIRDLLRLGQGSSRAGQSLGKLVVQALEVLSDS